VREADQLVGRSHDRGVGQRSSVEGRRSSSVKGHRSVFFAA
jgi:hypothetical protein